MSSAASSLVATVTANLVLVLLGRHLAGQHGDGLSRAVMDDHRPPLHQRCRHQFGITAVTQQQGQIRVVDVGFGDRQAVLVGR